MSKIEGLERRKKEEIGVEDIRILENEIAELRKELRQSTKEHIDWNKVMEAITESAKLANQVVSVAAKCKVM